MPRDKPQVPDDLYYLRKVMKQSEEKDDPTDLGLAVYRGRVKARPEWIIEKKAEAEKAYRAELVAWKKEVEQAAAAVVQTDAPVVLEPCEVVVRRFLQEYDFMSLGLDANGQPKVGAGELS